MAARYWAGGTGNWSDTGHWSAALPVQFTASCSGTALTTTGSPALSVGMTVFANDYTSLGTISSGSGNSWVVTVGGTYASQVMTAATVGATVPSSSDSAQTSSSATTSNYTITGDVAISVDNITIGNSTALSKTVTLSLNSTLTTAAGVTVSANNNNFVFTTNNNAVTTYSFSSTLSNITINLGSSTVTCTRGGSAHAWTITSGTTLNAGTSTIVLNTTSFAAGYGFDGGGKTYYTVQFTGATSPTIVGSNTFTNLTRTGTAVKTDGLILTSGTTQTVTGALTLAGNSSINRLLVASSTLGSAATISLNNTGTFRTSAGTANIDLRDITLTNAPTNEGDLSAITGLSGDCLGNTGITFTTGGTCNWTNVNGGNWADANWDLIGSANDRVPLPQDDVTFDCVFGTSKTVTVNMPRIGRNINWSQATWTTALTLLGNQLPWALFGSLTFKTGMTVTISSANSPTFYGRTSCTLTCAGVTGIQGLTVSMFGGSLTLQDSLTMSNSTGTLNITNGEFNTNNFNFSGYILQSTSGFTRTISFGTSAVTLALQINLTSAGATYNFSTATFYLTYVGSSTITQGMPNTTFGNIIISPTGSGAVYFQATDGCTFSNITMASAGTKIVQFQGGRTYTITGSSFLTGTPGLNITVQSSATTNFILSKTSGRLLCDYLTMSDCTASGGAEFFAGANSTVSDCPGWKTNSTYKSFMGMR